MHGPDAYVPITEAAQRLGVSVDTIRRRIRAGEMLAQRELRPQGYRWLVKLPESPTVVEVHPAVTPHAHMQPQGVSAEQIERLIDALERVAEQFTPLNAVATTELPSPPPPPDFVPPWQLIRADTAPPTQQRGQTPMQAGRLPWWRRVLAFISA